MDRSMIPSVVKDSIGGGSLNHKGLIAACLFRKRNGSGETLHLDKRTQNVVKLEGGWGRAHKEHAVE